MASGGGTPTPGTEDHFWRATKVEKSSQKWDLCTRGRVSSTPTVLYVINRPYVLTAVKKLSKSKRKRTSVGSTRAPGPCSIHAGAREPGVPAGFQRLRHARAFRRERAATFADAP